MPIFFLLYFMAGMRLKNIVILAGSIFFYAWGAPRFIFVILGTTAIDFWIVRYMAASSSRQKRALLLCVSLFINVGLLFFFKYSNFFVENINVVLRSAGIGEISWIKVALPIGISFYTFETITYVVDVYRQVHKPLRNFWDYQLYIILFPKLIAGPIIRYNDFAEQIYDHTLHESDDNRMRGICRFIIGLAKKILIANVMGHAADLIFRVPAGDLGTVTAWFGALSYTMQIYFDFSGYSDMAIGLGLMMGFRIPENFNNPYTATSITDFWRRWHISLGNWMRNYVYIPLGGNRVGSKWRLYFNLWLVFLASGLWHGAAWGFVIWGAYHGLFLVIERMFLLKWLDRLGKLSFLYTFFVVMTGWVLFRTEHLGPAMQYMRRMFSFHPVNELWRPGREYYVMLALALFFSFFSVPKVGRAIQHKVFHEQYSARFGVVATVISVILLVVCAARVTQSSFNPFIYFRF